MIKLFNATDTSFSSNGEKIIQPTYANIHKEDNGAYYLEIEAPLSYADDLVPNSILVANTPTGYQAFRISNVEKTRIKIRLKAYHVFYDSMNYVIKDSYVVSNTCNYALDHFNNATDSVSPFTTTSDVSGTNSYRCVRKSLYEAINVVIERWGGHLVRDNFSIQVKESIGADNEVTIRYGKNLKEINAQYDWSNVVTKILPVGYDGIMLPEEYLEGVNQYDIPYTKVISFEQDDIDPEDYETEVDYQNALIGDLRAKATEYLKEYSVPKVNYTLNANVEKITDIGDIIEVIDERLGIELTTNVISFDYNCILEKYTQIVFGNFKPTLDNLMKNIEAQTNEAIIENNATMTVKLNTELQKVTDSIMGVMGNSYVIYDGDKILVVDTLPKENATNVIRINSGGIGFSSTGINGVFNSAWSIDGTLNMQNINVINLTADLIEGGTLKLGSNLNEYGTIEVYDENNILIATLDKNGLTSMSTSGAYVRLNADEGLVGYDINGNKVYWVQDNVFHMENAEVENKIKIAGKIQIVPVNTQDNTGVGFVAIS